MCIFMLLDVPASFAFYQQLGFETLQLSPRLSLLLTWELAGVHRHRMVFECLV